MRRREVKLQRVDLFLGDGGVEGGAARGLRVGKRRGAVAAAPRHGDVHHRVLRRRRRLRPRRADVDGADGEAGLPDGHHGGRIASSCSNSSSSSSSSNSQRRTRQEANCTDCGGKKNEKRKIDSVRCS